MASILKMNIYKVSWVITGGGDYIPPDPCVGGDYHSDLYGWDIVTASTAKIAKAAILIARPTARVVDSPIKLSEA